MCGLSTIFFVLNPLRTGSTYFGDKYLKLVWDVFSVINGLSWANSYWYTLLGGYTAPVGRRIVALRREGVTVETV